MVNVAICQVGSIIHNTKATLEKLKKYTKIAAEKCAQLVLFPGICDYFNIIFCSESMKLNWWESKGAS